MPTGYVHLLFLAGVLLSLSHPLHINKVIMAFTLGHKVTLLFGTAGGARQ